MDASGTPHDTEPLTLEFEGRILTLNEPAIGKVILEVCRSIFALMRCRRNLDMRSRTIICRKSILSLYSLESRVHIRRSSLLNLKGRRQERNVWLLRFLMSFCRRLWRGLCLRRGRLLHRNLSKLWSGECVVLLEE